MNELMPFIFQEVKLKEACWINNKPHFTRRAIGEWLGYSHPIQAVTKIIERNPHILTFAVVVNLTTTDGKGYDTQVIDPIGFQLIVNKSNQPKALEFQIAAANLVLAYMRGEIAFAGVRRIPETLTLEALAQVAPYTRGIGKACALLGAEMNKSPRAIRILARRMHNGEPVRHLRQPGGMCFQHRKHRGQYSEVLRLRAMGLKLREIREKTGLPVATVHRWTKAA